MDRLREGSNAAWGPGRHRGQGRTSHPEKSSLIRTGGAEKMHKLAEGVEAYIHGPADSPIELRIVPLLEAMKPPRPKTMVMGITLAGKPLLFDLESRSIHHMLIEAAEGDETSEFLRSLACSLSLTTVPAQAQLFPVDMGGRELVVLEGLPHSPRGMASDKDSLDALLVSLEREVMRRLQSAVAGPHLVVMVHGLQLFLDGRLEAQLKGLIRIGEVGGPLGVHLLMAGAAGTKSRFHALEGLHGLALVGHDPGFEGRSRKALVVTAGNERIAFVAGMLTLYDLDRAFRQIALGGRLDLRARGVEVWPALSLRSV